MRIKYNIMITYQYCNIHDYDVIYCNGHINELIGDYCCFKDNKENGEFKLWWHNGQIASHHFYKNGEENGEYDIFGNLHIYS